MKTGGPPDFAAVLERLWRAWRCSMAGVVAAWRNEAAFRQELVLSTVLVVTCAALPASLTQKALLLASVALVLVIELVNSAVEATVDRISLEAHELAGRAKDMGSAAVLVALVNLVLVWGLVLVDIFRAA